MAAMGTALGLPPPIAAPRPSRPETESTRSADDRSASAAERGVFAAAAASRGCAATPRRGARGDSAARDDRVVGARLAARCATARAERVCPGSRAADAVAQRDSRPVRAHRLVAGASAAHGTAARFSLTEGCGTVRRSLAVRDFALRCAASLLRRGAAQRRRGRGALLPRARARLESRGERGSEARAVRRRAARRQRRTDRGGLLRAGALYSGERRRGFIRAFITARRCGTSSPSPPRGAAPPQSLLRRSSVAHRASGATVRPFVRVERRLRCGPGGAP